MMFAEKRNCRVSRLFHLHERQRGERVVEGGEQRVECFSFAGQ
jgi:hypothetical protein